ncbi:unnamed protein product, partial [Prorocentrum cordatum]
KAPGLGEGLHRPKIAQTRRGSLVRSAAHPDAAWKTAPPARLTPPARRRLLRRRPGGPACRCAARGRTGSRRGRRSEREEEAGHHQGVRDPLLLAVQDYAQAHQGVEDAVMQPPREHPVGVAERGHDAVERAEVHGGGVWRGVGQQVYQRGRVEQGVDDGGDQCRVPGVLPPGQDDLTGGDRIHIHALAVWIPGRDPADRRSQRYVPRGASAKKLPISAESRPRGPRGRGYGYAIRPRRPGGAR